MGPRILLVVQGMYLQADSIAYDAAFQARALARMGFDVQVFVERFAREHYPDIPARPIGELARALSEGPARVIYHWVDGWHEIDTQLRSTPVATVIRWHNNTPPWFFAPYSPIPTQKTVRGYLGILRFAEAAPAARIWVNSEFSRRQLAELGIDASRCDVVFPASYELEHAPSPEPRPAAAANGDGAIRLLFVGRVVPHKGHRHVLAAAEIVQRVSGRPLRVHFPGRPDPDMAAYADELHALARRLGVGLDLPGEVSRARLTQAYQEADVFVGLSEHEGFGLPLLEAMARGVPVVGFRGSAVAALLRDHPLATDVLDPVEIARRILAAIESDAVGRALVDWQRRAVLPRFAKSVLLEQIDCAMAEAAGRRAAPEPATEAAPAAVHAALRQWQERPLPGVQPALALPRDPPERFVTRHDLAAYETLLRTSAAGGSLRDRALSETFGSHRPVLGGLLSLAKRLSLRLQDGLVRTIQMSHDDLAHELASLRSKVDLLAAELARAQSSSKHPPGPDAPDPGPSTSEPTRARGAAEIIRD